jgi:broad specificity phosphatase PhoE
VSLFLVRHGQASAGSEDYDALSERGVRQSCRLGEWLADTGHEFDAVAIGGMRRHRQTYEAVAEAYRLRGRALPEARLDRGLDEFDHHAVFDGFVRAHPSHPSVLGRKDGNLQSLGALIHAALTAWSEDRLADVPESWGAFGARVRDAGSRMIAHGSGKILALTSGGVISRLAQQAMALSDRGAIDLNLSLRNSGLCEFHRRPYGLALGSWNALPHLHDARELWTYY